MEESDFMMNVAESCPGYEVNDTSSETEDISCLRCFNYRNNACKIKLYEKVYNRLTSAKK